MVNKKTVKFLYDKAFELMPESPKEKPNMLIIDDENQNLKAFKALFRRTSNVFTASNIKEAMLHMKRESIDIIFCDYFMPVINGAELLSKICEEYPNVKRVGMTASDLPLIKREFREKSNTTQFVFKPYTVEAVNSAIYG